nr:RNA-directed DNA polymerase, eukaryota [Tanacetum cinerariifolium]
MVLGDIVNEVQSTFVTDRQILDGSFILNELFQWCKSKKKHSFIFKVDFEKAYDSVRWDYLDDVFKKFGFGERWCGWIQECLRSSWGSVIVNGSPMKEFQFFKGLKQGDPLSPFIFILIMESLHILFQRVVDAGMFKGIVLDSSMQLSHMFYADDAVFMGQWSNLNINTIVHVLKCFHRASSLSINMSKSKIIGIAMNEDMVEQAVSKIGCAILKEMDAFKKQGTDLYSFMQKKLGNGANTYFWEDVWRENMALKHKYPRLYALELNKNIDVAAKLVHASLAWALEGSGDFSIASVRKLLDDRRFPDVSSKTRWIKVVPITRYGYCVYSLSDMWYCNEIGETLFFDCHVAKDICRKIYRWWDVGFMGNFKV